MGWSWLDTPARGGVPGQLVYGDGECSSHRSAAAPLGALCAASFTSGADLLGVVVFGSPGFLGERADGFEIGWLRLPMNECGLELDEAGLL